MKNKPLKNNIEHVKARYPDLAERLEEVKPTGRFKPVSTKDNYWDLLSVEADNEPFYGVDNPHDLCTKKRDELEIGNPAILVFLGLDLGYLAVAMMAKPSDYTQACMFVEKDLELFWHLLHVIDIGPFIKNPKMHFVVGAKQSGLFLALREPLNHNLLFTLVNRGTAFIDQSASYQMDKEYYRAVQDALVDATRDLNNYYGNSALDTYVGMHNMLLNLDVIAREPGVVDLIDKFKGRPAFIVATGPSLDKNYHLLKGLQNKGVMIACDASLKFLLSEGIKPHMATCLERGIQSAELFEGIDPEDCKDTYQVAVPVVRPEVYEVYPGPKALMYRTLIHFNWLENDKGTVLTGHSCANMAFKLAEGMGCDPIVLIGQDLAYGPDDTTHSKGAAWGKCEPRLSPEKRKTIEVPGNLQETVKTTEVWRLFRDAFVRDIAEFEGTVFNCTEGGAFIEGSIFLPLAQVVGEMWWLWRKFDPLEEIRKALVVPTEEEAQAFLDSIKVKSKESAEYLDKISTSFLDWKDKLVENLKGEEPDGRKELMEEAYIYWSHTLLQDKKFALSALQVVQPAFVLTMQRFFDLPNYIRGDDGILRARIGLLAHSFKQISEMIDRLIPLYIDPETAPRAIPDKWED
jgi:hypothetical protein